MASLALLSCLEAEACLLVGPWRVGSILAFALEAGSGQTAPAFTLTITPALLIWLDDDLGSEIL